MNIPRGQNQKMSKRWIIADPHFGHKSIIEYENRPFNSVEEMDKVMLTNWNKTIDKNDKVFLLGDFAFANSEETKQYINSLNGYKILVLGNHDLGHSVAWWLKAGFNEVSAYPIIVDEWYMFSHEPLYVNRNMPYANVFGHVHNNPAYADCSSRSFCVSVERISYTPIDFEVVKQRISMEQS